MINSIYTNITIILATALFVLGLLFRSLCRSVGSPVFKTALRIMLFTYCSFGLVNLLELWSRSFLPSTDDILLLQITTLVVAVLQAFLFTYTLILLIHAAYVTRKSVLRELIPILTLSIILVIAYCILPDDWVKIFAYLFALYYAYLLIKYTWLFVVTYRKCLQKMDNFFSGQEAEHLRWVKISFYTALSIGTLALVTSLFPAILIGIACSVVYLVFYLYFAFRFIKHSFIYEKLEEALSDDDDDTLPEEPEDNKNALCTSIVKLFETNLKTWIDEKQYLQPNVTIGDIAQQIGTNKKYFSVYINQHLNMPFRTWINDLRMEEAKRLLTNHPDMSIKQVSDKAGFTSNSYFGNLFLKMYEQTPQVWRKEQLGLD